MAITKRFVFHPNAIKERETYSDKKDVVYPPFVDGGHDPLDGSPSSTSKKRLVVRTKKY